MNMVVSQHSLRRHMLFVGVLGLALVGGVGGWAATTTLSNAVVGEGTVIIDDNVKKVQHLTGGIVSELFVREGQHVKAGDVLLQLDGTSLRANLGIINSTLAQLYARRTRLQAERADKDTLSVDDIAASGVDVKANKLLIDGELQLFETRRSALAGMKKQLGERKGQLAQEIEGHTIQLKATEDATKLIDEEYQAINSLYEKQIVTMQRVNALKRQRVELDGNRGQRLAARAQAEGRISEINLQILQLGEDRRSENAKDLTEVEANAAEMEERRVAILDQLKRLDLRAPMDGRVYQLAVHTVGGVVNPGEALMLLAPDTRNLTVEAKIASRNIDSVTPGQKVDVRFSAFDQRTTPEVEGEVVSVSPDIVVDQRTGASYYPVRIKPSAETLANLKSMALYPGMPAEVFIKVADRSVVSYFMKPLTDQINHTFREE
ncbi:HlyD family type I secretion periplasmic adaptor subunit [Rhizobium sp. XQZ8]|uniref:HlyD family type I secretion periplasmic adaptor subunit n=1 Tax=Rhizobium populisoli TaxID=2859785 RepID=UPI001CA47F7A|nr:HlyD family type I secretion periplasmic adaptor subunit [Rhizobium populisoli]MBW6425264.1 HlyD family type I secretion periplasmic adaptor subunit [Rhizobium populisoli]